MCFILIHDSWHPHEAFNIRDKTVYIVKAQNSGGPVRERKKRTELSNTNERAKYIVICIKIMTQSQKATNDKFDVFTIISHKFLQKENFQNDLR